MKEAIIIYFIMNILLSIVALYKGIETKQKISSIIYATIKILLIGTPFVICLNLKDLLNKNK